MKRILVLAGFLLLLSGCAVNVRMTGFLDPSVGTSALLPGTSLSVLENGQARNPIFDQEVRGKIETLLVKHGYRIAAQDQADYLLAFSYDISSGMRIGMTTAYGPPQTQVTSAPDGKGGRIFSTVTTPGAASVMPTFTEMFTRRLTLKVIDSHSVRMNQPEKVVWIGETLSAEPSSDLRHDIDYLLAAAFAYFGRDTGKQVNVRVGADNPDVVTLRAGAANPRAP
jgi:hypothetical protein